MKKLIEFVDDATLKWTQVPEYLNFGRSSKSCYQLCKDTKVPLANTSQHKAIPLLVSYPNPIASIQAPGWQPLL